MTSPCRALCAELADVVYEYCILHEGRDHLQPLVDRARELLAQPVAEVPTDEELANAARKALDSYRYAYATELPYFLREDSNEYEPLMLAIRAAIARYGGSTSFFTED